MKIKKQKSRGQVCGLCPAVRKYGENAFSPSKGEIQPKTTEDASPKNTAAQRSAAGAALEMPDDDFFAVQAVIPIVSFLWYESGYTPFGKRCQYKKRKFRVFYFEKQKSSSAGLGKQGAGSGKEKRCRTKKKRGCSC